MVGGKSHTLQLESEIQHVSEYGTMISEVKTSQVLAPTMKDYRIKVIADTILEVHYT